MCDPSVTPLARRILEGKQVIAVLGADTIQGRAAIEQLSKSEEWVLKISPGPSSDEERRSLGAIEFPVLLNDSMFEMEDNEWKKVEDSVRQSLRGAFGLYVAYFPKTKAAGSLQGLTPLDLTDDEREVMMVQRLGRVAIESGVHQFVFSGRDPRSEACLMGMKEIPSTLFLRVDSLMEELKESSDWNLSNNLANNEDAVGLISATDVGKMAGLAFTNPSVLGLPGKKSIGPLAVDVVSRKKLIERLDNNKTHNSNDSQSLSLSTVGADESKAKERLEHLAEWTKAVLPNATHLTEFIQRRR